MNTNSTEMVQPHTVRAMTMSMGFDTPVRFVVQEIEPGAPRSDEAMVQVIAIALRPTFLDAAATGTIDSQHGHGFVGMVEQRAADGSGPPPGTRVVGRLPAGAWVARVAVGTQTLVPIPASLPATTAAILPSAGLSALEALDRAGSLLGRMVLITGGDSEIGLIALQLARQAGAEVAALTEEDWGANLARAAGAFSAVGIHDRARMRTLAPFDVIVDIATTTTADDLAALLSPDGTFVVWDPHWLDGPNTQLADLSADSTAASIHVGMQRLVRLAADGALHVHVSVEAPLWDFGNIAPMLFCTGTAGAVILNP